MPRTSHTAALALGYADRLIVGTTRDVHRAIARRAFRSAYRVGGRVPERVHDAITDVVYDSVSLGVRGARQLLEMSGTRGVGPSLDATVGGRHVVSAINGLVGAELAQRADPHAISMSVRVAGQDVPTTSAALRIAYPHASDRIAIFLHGLGENDDSWRLGERKRGSTYASRLVGETEHTPIFVRYNTGLNVSSNGAALGELIAALVEDWPVAVSQIALIGHSMGGLVARAATNHAVASGAVWPQSVRHIVCLGTPHLGAPLEKAVHVSARALGVFPESAPFGRILDVRSPGIVDLRHGYISQAEWEGQDLTRQWGLDRIAAAPLAHAEYYFVAASLGSTPRSLTGRLLGDWFVRVPSAVGRSRHAESVVPSVQIRHVSGAGHFALLNHPDIASSLVRWLGKSRVAITDTTARVRHPTGGQS